MLVHKNDKFLGCIYYLAAFNEADFMILLLYYLLFFLYIL